MARFIAVSPSPVSNTLPTSRTPSPSDVLLITEALPKLHPSLLEINRNIAPAPSVLGQVLQNREGLRQCCCEHKVILSSTIRQFPHELLSDIFLLSIPAPKYLDAQTLKRAVMLPGQICRHWRNVALSTPRLWCQIILDFKKQSLEGEAAFVQKWLARSGGCPLSISLSQFMAFDVSTPITAFNLIVAHSDRWEDLDIIVSHPLLDALRSARPQLSRLQTLSIQSKTVSETILDAFETAPRLHSLTIGDNMFPRMLRIPWSQLTYCDLHPYQLSIADCFEVLQHSPNLVECHVHLYRPGLHHSYPLIQHEHLRVLSIRTCTELGPFFDNLIMPALQTFSCSESEYRYRWAQPQFLSFLTRSSCPLRRLRLDFQFVPLTDEDLIHTLQLVPSLMELELRRECARRTLTRTLLAQLTPTAQKSGCLLPNLRVLALDVYPGLDGGAFTDMIESRQCLDTGMALLMTVSLSDCTDCGPRWFDPLTISRLKNCRAGGLDIYRSRGEGWEQPRLPLE